MATPGVFASTTAEPPACGAHPEPVHADELLGAAGCPGTASRVAAGSRPGREGLLRPVEDFELLVTAVSNDLVHPLPGRGPSIPVVPGW